jgi:hypothetical protein
METSLMMKKDRVFRPDDIFLDEEGHHEKNTDIPVPLYSRRNYCTGPKSVLADYQEYLERGTRKQQELHDIIAAQATRWQLSGQRRRFGQLREVTVNQFLNAIEKEDAMVPVIIHIYERNQDACMSFSHCLAELAQKYIYAKFLQLSAAEAGLEHFTEDMVPSLLIYYGGELKCSYIRVLDDLPFRYTLNDLESWFVEQLILSSHWSIDSS